MHQQLKNAVDALPANPNAKVYLDATHPAWLGVGDIAARLVKAGVERSAGFFLNVSNYQYTVNSVYYAPGSPTENLEGPTPPGARNEHWNGATFFLIARLAPSVDSEMCCCTNCYRSVDADDPALNVSGYASRFWSPLATPLVFVDTSPERAGPVGVGPLDGGNPPGRGPGPRPSTANTSKPARRRVPLGEGAPASSTAGARAAT